MFFEISLVFNVILFSVLMMMFARTPAKAFLRSWRKGLPVALYIPQVGRAKFISPKKKKRGKIIIDAPGPQNHKYAISQDSTVHSRYGPIGLVFEGRGIVIHPRVTMWANELAQAGFRDLPEAELSYHIHQIEEELGREILPDKKYKIFTGDKGDEPEIISGTDLLKQELKDRNVNPWIINNREISNALQRKKHAVIEQVQQPLENMIHFFSNSCNPSNFNDWVAEEKVAMKESSLFAKAAQTNFMGWVMLLLGIAIAISILWTMGILPAALEALTTSGDAATQAATTATEQATNNATASGGIGVK